MKDYDIGKAFEAIENELIASMMRNMDKHRAWEDEEGIQWEQWQALQLKALEQYKKKNQTKYSGQFKSINKQIEVLLREARQKGNMQQEITILNAIKNGFKAKKISKGAAAEFFKINERKLDALIKATTQDMEKAETAVLRMANDQYRKIIFNAQVYVNSGAGTYEKAVDMATKDFLSAGLNCIEYVNGARHTISDYADMAIRTASKRAYLQGEGEKRKEWGISTVIMNKRGNSCPKCLPFVGKVLIDDVWSGGSQKDGKYPLMSSAIAAGLYHPRCKDSHTTYFEGISTPPEEKYTKNELQEIEEDYKADQKLQYAKRQEKKFGRLAKYSLDEENKRKYSRKQKVWDKVARAADTMMEHDPLPVYQLNKEYRDDIFAMINQSDDRIQKTFLKFSDDITFINTKAISGGVSKKTGIRLNWKKDKNENLRGSYTTTFHEIGHAIDRASGFSSCKNEKFKNAILKDFYDVVNEYKKVYNIDTSKAYMEIGRKIRAHEYHAVSDLVSIITENKCVGTYKHKKGYWLKPYALEREAFAHFYEAFARNDVVKMDILQEMFPDAVEEFFEILESL